MFRHAILLAPAALMWPLAILSCDEPADNTELTSGNVVITDETGEPVAIPPHPPETLSAEPAETAPAADVGAARIASAEESADEQDEAAAGGGTAPVRPALVKIVD